MTTKGKVKLLVMPFAAIAFATVRRSAEARDDR
jgi:hypothetical protein